MEVRSVLTAAVLSLICLWFSDRRRRYKRSSYYRITRNAYELTMKDKGRFGEYQIFKKLAFYEQGGARFLFNCYLPRGDGGTTEIDVLMIHHSGIYVFESKNYSGRICGRETDQNWTQLLKKKTSFLNPLRQNRSHVIRVRKLMGLGKETPVYSLVVFSDRCVLEKMAVKDPDCQVTNWKGLRRAVRRFAKRQPGTLEKRDVERLYQSLYPYTRVSRKEKREHIRNIHRRWGKRSIFW